MRASSRRTEADPLQRKLMEAISSRVAPTSTDAIGTAIRAVSSTTLRIANQRPRSPVVSLSPRAEVAGRLTLVWGVRSRLCDTTCESDAEMVAETSAEGTLSVHDALRSFSIRTMVAARQTEASKKLLDAIVLGNKSIFLNTQLIL